VKYVLDASVALKWYLSDRPDEPNVDEAIIIADLALRDEIELYAPVHLSLEVVAVLSRYRPDLVPDAIVELSDFSSRLVNTPVVLGRAAEISIALNHHLFDTLYHAVALEVGATLVTADDRYFEKAMDLGHIQRLADFTTGSAARP
jgi:predicted nucleic acid-binding protein